MLYEQKKEQVHDYDSLKLVALHGGRMAFIIKDQKSSSNELPQIINVLKGNMSLVAPRPAVIDEVAQCYSSQDKRLEIKSGSTCLWQACDRYNGSFEYWVRLDVE